LYGLPAAGIDSPPLAAGYRIGAYNPLNAPKQGTLLG
jgi:hypothetical protein